MKLIVGKDDNPVIVLASVFSNSLKSTEKGEVSKLILNSGSEVTNAPTIARLLARNSNKLYSDDLLTSSEIDHFIRLGDKLNFTRDAKVLNDTLLLRTFLTGKELSVADYICWAYIRDSKSWNSNEGEKMVNLTRWFNHVAQQEPIKKAELAPPKMTEKGAVKEVKVTAAGRKQEGTFVELEGAKMGEVVTRFPPEASGFLHIGHAKACLLNAHYQTSFKGKLIMRFDDTNPAKEKEDFEKIILKDVELLKVKPDIFSFTSDHFEKMLVMAEDMIKKGDAYCDDTPGEQMKEEREQRIEGKHRNNKPAVNMKMWEEMKKGSDKGKQTCLRAKIDMKSNNGALRDPAIYRVKVEPHPRHGSKYNVYPTYDFACPIVDSVEGVTHALRTTEYMDRDDQYFWFIEKLGLRKPHIWAYSRLNLQHTVLSKRKLTYFVEEGLVDGWDDPRMPTVRGVVRRGMTVEGLKEFILAQGSSRSVVTMEWDKIWSFNKKVIDPIAPRHFGLSKDNLTLVNVVDAANSSAKHAFHPKNEECGQKDVFYSKRVFVESADAETFVKGENVTFVNWGNIKIEKVTKSKDGKVESVDAKLNLDDKDYKKTTKVTWLAESPDCKWTPAVAVEFDNIISKPILEKDDDFKQFINKDTRKSEQIVCDPQLANCKEGDIIQLQRRGFFRVDRPYKPVDGATFNDSPAVLFAIPDGRTKETHKSGSKHKEPTKVEEKPLSNKQKKKLAAQGGAAPAAKPSAAQSAGGNDAALALWEKTTAQGDLIREMKSKKASKDEITAAVGVLKTLKEDFKKASGSDYDAKKKPASGASSAPAASAPAGGSADLAVWEKVTAQGTKIRELKSKKAAKEEIMKEVEVLKTLKAEYKAATGSEYDATKKPSSGGAPAAQPASQSGAASGDLALWEKVTAQGTKIRELKSKKAAKDVIMPEVETLKLLKAEYKNATGTEYDANKKPAGGAAAPAPAPAAVVTPVADASNGNLAVWEKVTAQGNKIRELKSKKAAKEEIMKEVDALKALKAEYKAATGSEYDANKKPAGTSAPAPAAAASGDLSLWEKVTAQGTAIRKMKSEKASKDDVMAAVNILKELKANYKSATGTEYDANKKPAGGASQPAAVASQTGAGDSSSPLYQACVDQGNAVRDLKTAKASKDDITAAVAKLLKLKEEYKAATGQDYKPPAGGSAPRDTKKSAPKPKKEDKKQKVAQQPKKGESRLGVEVSKSDNLAEWYQQTITKADLIEYYDVSGCYVLLPGSYAIWESVKDFFDAEIKKLGVENSYFPMFVSQAALEKEKDHIADFSPEVAWVTRSGKSELAEPIAIRPTSETVMYPVYAKRVQSHRDLPIKLNQWCNVVRWEFKHPTPFLRTREFLWQEGHTAFANIEEAHAEVYQILDLYRRVYEDLLAIPVVPGKKTEKEKFAGGDFTTTVEAYIKAAGRAIQGATSHHLGQNFSKMFDISYEDPVAGKDKLFAHQNSWGITTRTIGVMIMVHADDKGLICPPRVSKIQAVIVPCGATKTDEEREALFGACQKLEEQLKSFGIRAHADLRDDKKPGWKFNYWELRGVPLRIEIGPKDLENKAAVFVRRDTGTKETIEGIQTVPYIAKTEVTNYLENIHESMFKKAKNELAESMVRVSSNGWDEFMANLAKGHIIQAPYCNNPPCEDQIKELSSQGLDVEAGAPSMGAKALCMPFNPIKPFCEKTESKCICPGCQNKAVGITLFGRSY